MTDYEQEAITDALDALEAAAARAGSVLFAAVSDHGYRTVAAATGLSLATVQRWRLEVPPAATLRTARLRRA